MCNKHESNTFMAFAKSKCPRCHSGKLFTHPFYDLKNFSKYRTHCPVCNLKFEKETGFFWSAMYISYGVNVALSLIIGIVLSVFFNDPDANVYVAAIVVPVLLGSTYIFRLSRIIALYGLSGFKYDKVYDKK
jgi:uncharacterized protein (DUF983 family)